VTGADRPRPAFPWEQAMAFGLGRLRLAPRDFWSMTPRELAAAMSAHASPVPAPGRDELERMMQRFPDPRKGSQDHG